VKLISDSTLILPWILLLLSIKLSSFFNGSGAAWKVENDDLAITPFYTFPTKIKAC